MINDDARWQRQQQQQQQQQQHQHQQQQQQQQWPPRRRQRTEQLTVDWQPSWLAGWLEGRQLAMDMNAIAPATRSWQPFLCPLAAKVEFGQVFAWPAPLWPPRHRQMRDNRNFCTFYLSGSALAQAKRVESRDNSSSEDDSDKVDIKASSRREPESGAEVVFAATSIIKALNLRQKALQADADDDDERRQKAVQTSMLG
ncbi:hypothetical protein AWZ03_007607 [Drosophila navojoa]|uniref:Uncharacterized protein n=1 Tax=Drosophila navojoa TaxID=7232 RepID=A0A484BAK4_DRONA|nr:hypothetical protein AWZ03_007607 [Drosophila navojoa]